MWDASIALQAWEEVEPNFRGWAEAAGMAAAADGVLYRFAVKHIVPDAGAAVASHGDKAARLAAAAAAAEEARQVVAATEKAALEAVRLEAAEAGRAGAAAADEVTRVGLAPRSFLCLSLHPPRPSMPVGQTAVCNRSSATSFERPRSDRATSSKSRPSS